MIYHHHIYIYPSIYLSVYLSIYLYYLSIYIYYICDHFSMTHLKVPTLPHRFPHHHPRCSWSSLAWTIRRTRPRGKRREGTSARRIWATWWCIGRTWPRSHSFCAMVMDHHGSMDGLWIRGWVGEASSIQFSGDWTIFTHFHHWTWWFHHGFHMTSHGEIHHGNPWCGIGMDSLDSGIFRIRWPMAKGNHPLKWPNSSG